MACVLCPQGTKSRSQAQLEADIASIGGVLTATTTRETTVYQAQVLTARACVSVCVVVSG